MLTDYYGIVKECIKQTEKIRLLIFWVKITSDLKAYLTLMLTERKKGGTN